MKIIRMPSVERLLYASLILLFFINIAGLFLSAQTLVTLKNDDARKFRVLKSNQETLLCVVRESTNPIHTNIDPETFKFTVDNSYIDRCIKDNRVEQWHVW